MNRDEVRELAAVYALGALDGEDRARFEALLEAGDPEAVSALREFEDTAVELAGALVAAPPQRTRAALMERIDAAERSATAPRPVRPAPARWSWWPALWAGAMAAGLAAIVVGYGVSASYEQRLAALGREAGALRAELDAERAVLALLGDPATQIVALAGLEPAPSAQARMIWNASGGGLLVASGLPPAPEGKDYQLWAIAGSNAPVPAGVFGVDARGAARLTVPRLPGMGRADVFAVTLEPAGGRPTPSGPMYLAGKS
jgi:anti-sigma-K factor RskA